MKTVWLVEKGSVPDWTVVGVYSSKERAEAVAAALNEELPDYCKHTDGAAAWEWPIDEPPRKV